MESVTAIVIMSCIVSHDPEIVISPKILNSGGKLYSFLLSVLIMDELVLCQKNACCDHILPLCCTVPVVTVSKYFAKKCLLLLCQSTLLYGACHEHYSLTETATFSGKKSIHLFVVSFLTGTFLRFSRKF